MAAEKASLAGRRTLGVRAACVCLSTRCRSPARSLFVRLATAVTGVPTRSLWVFLLWWLAMSLCRNRGRVAHLRASPVGSCRSARCSTSHSCSRTNRRRGSGWRCARAPSRASRSGCASLREANEAASAQEAAEILLQLAGALDVHDKITRGHAERVRAYSYSLGKQLSLRTDELDRLNWAALLHDIGKLDDQPGDPEQARQADGRGMGAAAPPSLVRRDARRAAQRMARRRGPTRSGTTTSTGTARATRAASPVRRSRSAGRIVAIADVYDVITSARSYKEPASPTEARAELARCAGTQFDPRLVRAFVNISLGKMRLVMGPLSWLSHAPLLARLPLTPFLSTSLGGIAVIATTAATGIAGPQDAAQAASLRAARPAAPIVESTQARPAPAPARPTLRPATAKNDPPERSRRTGRRTERHLKQCARSAPTRRRYRAVPLSRRHLKPSRRPRLLRLPPQPPEPRPLRQPRPAPPPRSSRFGAATAADASACRRRRLRPPPPRMSRPASPPAQTRPCSKTPALSRSPAGRPRSRRDRRTSRRKASASPSSPTTRRSSPSSRPSLPTERSRYTPAADANGVATVTVTARDDGGTANGGTDTSAPRTFTITITPVNDAPDLTAGANKTKLEDAGAQSVAGWATAISPGPANESSQNVTLHRHRRQPGALHRPAGDRSRRNAHLHPRRRRQRRRHHHRHRPRRRRHRQRRHRHQRSPAPSRSPSRRQRRPQLHRRREPDRARGRRRAVHRRLGDRNLARARERVLAERHLHRHRRQPGALQPSSRRSLPTERSPTPPPQTPTASPPSPSAPSTTAAPPTAGSDTSAPSTFTITLTARQRRPQLHRRSGSDGYQPPRGADRRRLGNGHLGRAGGRILPERQLHRHQRQPGALHRPTDCPPQRNAHLHPDLLALGIATVTVRAVDNGGTANGGSDTSAPQTFTITIL